MLTKFHKKSTVRLSDSKIIPAGLRKPQPFFQKLCFFLFELQWQRPVYFHYKSKNLFNAKDYPWNLNNYTLPAFYFPVPFDSFVVYFAFISYWFVAEMSQCVLYHCKTRVNSRMLCVKLALKAGCHRCIQTKQNVKCFVSFSWVLFHEIWKAVKLETNCGRFRSRQKSKLPTIA